MAAESPGPKYNVHSLASNGGRTGAPRFSFAPPPSSPRETRSRLLPNVDSPRRGHRESWLTDINRNGVLVMPASPAGMRPRDHGTAAASGSTAGGGNNSETTSSNNNPGNAHTAPPPSSPSGGASTRGAFGARSGSVFGSEHRFGVRQDGQPKTPRQNTRVQFVSARHTRENMGEFSPGPIYSPRTPDCPGGRLAPAPPASPPDSPAQRGRRREPKDPHANMSSRSSWLAGAVRKNGGQETVLLRMGDVPPGPGSYAEPLSSFTAVSHNVKARSPSPSTVSSPQSAGCSVAHTAIDGVLMWRCDRFRGGRHVHRRGGRSSSRRRWIAGRTGATRSAEPSRRPSKAGRSPHERTTQPRSAFVEERDRATERDGRARSQRQTRVVRTSAQQEPQRGDLS